MRLIDHRPKALLDQVAAPFSFESSARFGVPENLVLNFQGGFDLPRFPGRWKPAGYREV
jgi:hypothetical protein